VTRRVARREHVYARGVGASEVGVLAGVDPFATPLELWRRKLGRASGPDGNLEALRIGRALEGPVVGLARDVIPLRIRRNRRTYVHPLWPAVPLFATPDAFVDGDRLLEAKVVGLRGAFAWDDGPPAHVILQARAQLAVLEAGACYIAALVGTELRLALVEREVEEEAELLAAVSAFVRENLEPVLEPDPVTDLERWAQLVAGASELDGEVLADADADAAGIALLELRASRSRIEADELRLRVELTRWLERSGGRRVVGSSWAAAWDARGTFSVRSRGTR
jgi:predicted phage-related endonuclease